MPDLADPAAPPTADFLRLVPQAFARGHLVLSAGIDADGQERIACTAGCSRLVLHNLGARLGRPVRRLPAEPEALAAAIDAAYESAAKAQRSAAAAGASPAMAADGSAVWDIPLPAAADQAAGLDHLLHDAERDLLATAGKAPLIQVVDRILFDAVQAGASDVHLQPMDEAVVIRMRVDGVLDAGRTVPSALLRPLASRIKVMGGMDVAEHLVPQDGRAGVRIADRAIDLRISTLPTAHGERVVIRLLDRSRQLAELGSLGMPADVAGAFRAATLRANGMVLVTGPTGSGKTTTLYAALRALDSQTRNLMTIEDPIEYELKGLGVRISQAQVNARKGVTFATGLRHILRQDPDVIMVGEIRDAETAHIAVQAALTGHLVFSTLHTNDAISAITRLGDLGIDAYKIADCLGLVLAQRLVRTTCAACAGRGCAVCSGTGLRGRTGLFEQVVVDDALRQRIARQVPLDELRAHARAQGMRTLAEEGRMLIDAGRTTPAEVARVAHG